MARVIFFVLQLLTQHLVRQLLLLGFVMPQALSRAKLLIHEHHIVIECFPETRFRESPAKSPASENLEASTATTMSLTRQLLCDCPASSHNVERKC
jgi:hypothetical protein